MFGSKELAFLLLLPAKKEQNLHRQLYIVHKCTSFYKETKLNNGRCAVTSKIRDQNQHHESKRVNHGKVYEKT